MVVRPCLHGFRADGRLFEGGTCYAYRPFDMIAYGLRFRLSSLSKVSSNMAVYLFSARVAALNF